MEGDYRLASGSVAERRHAGNHAGALVSLASVFVLAGLITASCASFAGDETHGGDGVQGAAETLVVGSGSAEDHSGEAGVGAEGVEGAEGMEKMGRQSPAPPEKLSLIVTLQVDEGTEAEHGDDPVAAVTARVMKRLETVMSAEDLAAVRTFRVLPIIALIADRDLIVRLLSMPEVASIERDHELRTPGEAESALELPAVELDSRIKSSDESDPTLDPPLLEPKLE